VSKSSKTTAKSRLIDSLVRQISSSDGPPKKTEYIDYHPAGQTLAEFHADHSFVRGMRGPFGTGKSAAMVMEIFRRANEQEPHQGVRRTRWAVIRNTTPELRTTAIKTWQEWIPERVCPFRWSPPLTASMRGFPHADGKTTIDMEVIFLALDTEKDVRHLQSLELTGAWINEAREVPKAILDDLTGRVNRYPAKNKGGPTWGGVIMDTNPPSIRHWWYRLAEQEQPDNWRFFGQPAALIREPDGTYSANPLAENVQNQPLGYKYWLMMIPGKDQDWINVRVLGEYGAIFEGRAVYEATWRDSVHVAKEPIGIYKGLPLYLGWDFGLSPACTISQITPSGRLNTIREYVATDSGLQQFVTDVVRPALLTEFSGMQIISRCDPSGQQRSQVDEMTCLGELNRLGILTERASTQDLVMRRDAVNFWLTRMVGGKPAYQLDPRCSVLREGFNGGYQFKRVRSVLGDTYKDEPDKNEYSHVAEALQYSLLGLSTGFPGGAQPDRQEGAAWPQTDGWAAAV